jgi:hypothetical protein
MWLWRGLTFDSGIGVRAILNLSANSVNFMGLKSRQSRPFLGIFQILNQYLFDLLASGGFLNGAGYKTQQSYSAGRGGWKAR